MKTKVDSAILFSMATINKNSHIKYILLHERYAEFNTCIFVDFGKFSLISFRPHYYYRGIQYIVWAVNGIPVLCSSIFFSPVDPVI